MNPRRNSATKTAPFVREVELPGALKFGKWPTELRFLRPDDEERLIEFFESHAPETIHDRYGFSPNMSHEHAARLVGVEQMRDAALGLFEASPAASLIAVGRYCLADDGQSAEVAFVVREDCRRLGIAATLLRLLVAIACERGLTRLTAQVNADNFRMLALFRQFGATLADISGAGAVEVNLDLVVKSRPTLGAGKFPTKLSPKRNNSVSGHHSLESS